jgi:hypothetical protein
MHEFKHGELRARGSGKVKNPRQAIAIALREAGATDKEPPEKNAQTLRKTKEKERKGGTAEAEAEGKAAQDRTLGVGASAEAATQSRNALYREA